MRYEISEDRKTLTIMVDAEEQAELRELKEEKGDEFFSDSVMVDFLERLTCNSELDWVRPDITGDLTDAPMLGIQGQVEEEPPGTPDDNRGSGLVPVGFWDGKAWCEPILFRWAYMDSDIRSPLQDLLEKGKVVFTGGPVLEREGQGELIVTRNF